MAKVNTYLNFHRNTEEAFNFYKQVFGGEFTGGISRFRDIPPAEGLHPLPEADKNLVMHVALPILGGHMLMGTDAPESMGFKVNFGNNVYINLQPDTREETRRLFKGLSTGGNSGNGTCRSCFGAITTEAVKINMEFNGCLAVLRKTSNASGTGSTETVKIINPADH